MNDTFSETKDQFWICWRGHGEERQELFLCRWLNLIYIELLLWLVQIPLLLSLKWEQGWKYIWSYSFGLADWWLLLKIEFDFDNFWEIFVPYIWSNSQMLLALENSNGSIICIPVSGFLRAYWKKNSSTVGQDLKLPKMNNNYPSNNSKSMINTIENESRNSWVEWKSVVLVKLRRIRQKTFVGI